MRIVSIFTGVAVLISILGFIGMSLFFIRQRKKEIGVRRIMGSTTSEVLSLLLTKFAPRFWCRSYSPCRSRGS